MFKLSGAYFSLAKYNSSLQHTVHYSFIFIDCCYRSLAAVTRAVKDGCRILMTAAIKCNITYQAELVSALVSELMMKPHILHFLVQEIRFMCYGMIVFNLTNPTYRRPLNPQTSFHIKHPPSKLNQVLQAKMSQHFLIF